MDSSAPTVPAAGASSPALLQAARPPMPSPKQSASSSASAAGSPALGLPTARKPAGIFNDTNTCFLNSTFQALSATPPLISLLAADPAAPLHPVPSTLLPEPSRPPQAIPSLQPDATEPELYPLLPVTREFSKALRTMWTIKDNGGGTSGANEESTTRSMSLRRLLKEIARKYDQYDDFRQQDAHELLRHLLDSMEMEERDVIKKLHPAETREADAEGDDVEAEQEAKAELVPFVDVLFGGLLASVVVCETCKSVSHTYEGFLDISLSLKSDAPRVRKRDRFRAMASRLKPRSASGKAPPSDSAVVSDPEGSDGEPAARSRRGSLDVDAGSRSVRSRPSFSFRRKKDGPGETASMHSSTTSLADDPPAPPPARDWAGPTAAQAAYIRRILYGPPGPPESVDPLAKLRAAHNGVTPESKSTDSGLIDSLKAFTAVEVLEGDNAFACRKCWRINAGRYGKIAEEDAGSPRLAGVDAPSITLNDSSTDLDLPESGRTGRSASLASGSTRAPSPLRRNVEFDEASNSVELASVSSYGATSTRVAQEDPMSDGLSDTSSSDGEEPSSRNSLARPRLQRAKSKHFVLRRAFKRYLIAKAPEVLVFHIKRFKQTQKSGMAFSNFYNLKKVDDFCSFPEQLDLAQFMAPNRADFKVTQTPQGPRAPYMDWASPEQGPAPMPTMYRLYAVVVHLGTMVGGHYIAYCLVDPHRMFGEKAAAGDADAIDALKQLSLDGADSKKDRRVWCHCSDTTIRLATVDEVLASRAYMCFYEKMLE